MKATDYNALIAKLDETSRLIDRAMVTTYSGDRAKHLMDARGEVVDMRIMIRRIFHS